MNKYIFLIFFILISFNSVLCESVYLPYTETSNKTQINNDFNNNTYSIYTLNDNEIYQIKNYYKFGLLSVNEGIYISNISFIHNYFNTTISEKYNITDAILSKKVTWDLLIYENDILTSNKHKEYYIFTTSCYHAKTKYTFLTDEIKIENDDPFTKIISIPSGDEKKEIETFFSNLNALIKKIDRMQINIDIISNFLSTLLNT